MASHVSLNAQIEEIEYEIRMRSEVYPRLILRQKLRQGVADEHMRRMRAVLASLNHLQAIEKRRAAE